MILNLLYYYILLSGSSLHYWQKPIQLNYTSLITTSRSFVLSACVLLTLPLVLILLILHVCYLLINNYFITNQITSCFCCFLICSFWRSFKSFCCRLFNMMKTFFTVFTTKVLTIFLSLILAKTKIYSLLQMFYL